MADIFSVVAEATRRDILQLLLDTTNPLTAHDIAEALAVTPHAVAAHLKVLSDHGFLEAHDEGASKVFVLDTEPMEELIEWLLPFLNSTAATSTAPDDGSTAVFAAWSGADVGETIGRAIADRSHGVRVVLEEATEKVAKHLPHGGSRKRADRP